MQTRIGKWGNSLALRIPRAFAVEVGLSQDSPVELKLEKGRIVIVPLAKDEPRLADLLAAVTPENLHGEVDTGDPVGREEW
jgi:antitoxin MazE